MKYKSKIGSWIVECNLGWLVLCVVLAVAVTTRVLAPYVAWYLITDGVVGGLVN